MLLLSGNVFSQQLYRYFSPYDKAVQRSSSLSQNTGGSMLTSASRDPYFSAPKVQPQPLECPLVTARRLQLALIAKKQENDFSKSVSVQIVKMTPTSSQGD